MAELYRKSSIEKLSNPEQLDRAITISSPMSWLALAGVALLIAATVIWSVAGTLPATVSAAGVIAAPQGVCAVCADRAGVISRIDKQPGDSLYPGEQIALLQTGDGGEVPLTASRSGKVSAVLAEPGQQVYAGAEILRCTPGVEAEQVAVCYVPVSVAGQLEENMEVLLYPSAVDAQKYGHMEGWIDSIGEYPASVNSLWYVLGADNLAADQFLSSGPVVCVVCRIRTDSQNGYYWSGGGGELTVANGAYLSAVIVTDRCAPITKLIHGLKEQWGS